MRQYPQHPHKVVLLIVVRRRSGQNVAVKFALEA